jgi:HK97 family phage portal protein
MGFLRRAAARFVASALLKGDLGTTQNPTPELVALMGGIQTGAGVQVSDTSALRVSVVYACVRVISEDIAKLPINIWREKSDGGREEATDHPLYEILHRPNRHMSIKNLLLALGASYGFRGNGIAVILRDERGRETGLWPVHPGSVTIYESFDGALFYAISRRTTLENAILRNVPIMVPDYDVFHVRGLTFDGIVGLSPLAQLRESIGIALAGENMSSGMLANGAQPTGVLKHPDQISAEAAANLRESWSARYSGASNTGKTIVLEEGMSWEQLSMTSVDAQFLEQRKFTVEEIARGFRVPLHMIGMLDRMTNNNVEALTKSYYDQALMPALEFIEAEFSRAFRLPPDIYVEFDVSALLRADYKARQEGKKLMTQTGAMKMNEWRVSEGFNPDPAGDVYLRPLNTAYVNSEGKPVMVAPAGGSDPTQSDSGAAPQAQGEGA